MNSKKIAATVLSIAMMIGCVPVTVGAEELGTEQEEILENTEGSSIFEDRESETPEETDDDTSDDEITDTDTVPVYNGSNSSNITVRTWDDLYEAVNNNTDVNIIFDEDITIPDTRFLFVTSDQTVVLDLNGHTLKKELNSAGHNGYLILNMGNVTITDSIGGGKLTGGYNSNLNNPYDTGGCICNGGVLSLNNITLQENKTINHEGGLGGAICNTGTLSITDCTFSGNEGADAGAIYNYNTGTLNLKSVTFTGNKSLLHGGGAVVNYGTVNMEDTVITGNRCKGNGGGFWNNGTLTVKGKITIEDNTSESNTNNLFLMDGKTVTIGGSVSSESVIKVTCQYYPAAIATDWHEGDDLNIFVFENGMTPYLYGSDVGPEAKYLKRSWNSSSMTIVQEIAYCPELPKRLTDNASSGWYYVYGNVNFGSRISIASGATVNLILDNSAKLNCTNGGINVPGNATLNIYGQPSDLGELKATGGEKQAGIGGNKEQSAGTINIYGGTITAIGGSDGAGIGSGYNSSALGTITIYGGYTTATGGSFGAGIGGGSEEDLTSGSITIRGGTVTAKGGDDCYQTGAGIGSGAGSDFGPNCTITISGGTVNAYGGRYIEPTKNDSLGAFALCGGSGIGSGAYTTGGGGDFSGKILIEGGMITANGSGEQTIDSTHGSRSFTGGAGIGSGHEGNVDATAEITITGGRIEAFGNYGGAAIGAGSEGTGTFTPFGGECEGKITITGGILYLRNRNGYTNSQLIGKGHCGSESGTLSLGEVYVKFESGDWHTEERDNRVAACRSQNGWVTLWINECYSHSISYSYDKTHHTATCRYCSYTATDNHHYDEHSRCTVCGYDYYGPVYIVSYQYSASSVPESHTVPEGSKFVLHEYNREMPDRELFVRWRVVDGDSEYYKNPGDWFIVNRNVTIYPVYDVCADLAGYSVSLDGDIGVNFYMELDPEIVSNDEAYMEFTLPDGSTRKVMMSSVRNNTATLNDKTYYIFKCNVSAREMSKEIKAQFFVTDEIHTEEYKFSVESYIRYLLDPDSHYAYPDAQELAEALLIYGYYAQTYFKVPGDRIVPPEGTVYDRVNAVKASDLEGYAHNPDNDDLPDGVSLAGASLSLKSETTLSLYLTGAADAEFSCDKGYDIETVYTDKYTVARIRGINAADLGDDITLKVKIDDNDYTVRYNPLTYCYNVLNGNYADGLKDVCRAIYVYYNAAAGYRNMEA